LAVRRCIEADNVRWAVVFGTSDNPRQLWNLAEARQVLGYATVDASSVDPRTPERCRMCNGNCSGQFF
jgi:hypothetical protein